MEPKFNPPQNNTPAVLICPNCGGDNLKHFRVEVFERKEDKENGVHVQIEEGKVLLDQILDGNPSSRRHGLSIRFVCEHCSAGSVLTIAQHKGATHVDFK